MENILLLLLVYEAVSFKHMFVTGARNTMAPLNHRILATKYFNVKKFEIKATERYFREPFPSLVSPLL